MVYNSFQDLKLSALGLGAMRLPVVDGDDSKIDAEETERLIDYAMEHGINFFDTAWGYHGGNSEAVVGKILSKYPRDSYYLATKFPGYDLGNMAKVEEIFEEQLRRCGVEYFDFYFFHNVSEKNIDAYLNKEYGVFAYLKKQKENGRIRHLGFSTHGEVENIREFLDTATGRHMEFCQIQLNWMDWTFQRAKEKVELLNERGLPVWVMEPLRGGKLLNLDQSDVETLKKLRPEETVYSWGLRFLQTVPGVTMVLSGLSSAVQTEENTRTFSEHKPLSEEEWNALQTIAAQMIEKKILPCTGCRYCVSHCPQKLNIPKLLDMYKQMCLTPNDFIAPRALLAMPVETRADACIACRACERVCPQGIKISEALADFVERAEACFQIRGTDISAFPPFKTRRKP